MIVSNQNDGRWSIRDVFIGNHISSAKIEIYIKYQEKILQAGGLPGLSEVLT